MKQKANVLSHILNVAMTVALLLMVVLVFGNVVLRYVFNSGIVWSEELARYLFIWMIFLGAIGALKDNEHLGVDMLIKRLSPAWKKVFIALGYLIVLYTLWLVLDGSWKMTLLNKDSVGPTTGMPLTYIYGIGIVMSIGMGIIVIINLYRVLFVKGAAEQLAHLKESEEEILMPLHDEQDSDSRGGKS